MSKLVKKLCSYNPTSDYSRVMREAADHIEKLEQAIEEHIEWAEKVIDCTDLHEALGGDDASL